MLPTTDPARDDVRHDARRMLTVRYDDTEQMWIRQKDAVQVLRDSIDSGAADVLDRATIRAQAEEQALLATSLRTQLDDLATAIERCDAGTYGVCERCGQTIPDERLTMFPAATHCVPCKQTLQHR
jgi:DnaK suppressor protein